GTNIRVDVRKFTSVNNRDVTYAQIAPRWNRNAPVMVGTLLTAGSAMKIFPAMDNPAHRATVDLCVRFTPRGHVRSNSPMKSVEEGMTCFARTFPVSTQQIGFAAFEKAETLIYNRTVLDDVYIPSVEIVFSLNKNFKREKHEWIYNEASKASRFENDPVDEFPLPTRVVETRLCTNPSIFALYPRIGHFAGSPSRAPVLYLSTRLPDSLGHPTMDLRGHLYVHGR
ncbi:hypothetical protein OESDEN_07046, partial [Oesophagostomum dentatum]